MCAHAQKFLKRYAKVLMVKKSRESVTKLIFGKNLPNTYYSSHI